MKLLLRVLLASLIFAAWPAFGRELNVVFIPKSSDQTFWDIMRVGVDEAVSELGGIKLTWRGPSYNDNYEAQIRIVELYTRPDTDVMILAPTDSARLVASVHKAVELGIKVIVVDSSLDGSEFQHFVTTDNYAAGQMAARHLAESLSRRGRIGVLRTVKGSGSTEDRAKGFLDYLKKNAPQITVVADEYGGGSSGRLQQVARKMLQGDPPVQGLFTVNESATESMLRALSERGMAGKVRLVGFDMSDYLLGALEKRFVDALVLQNPRRMGYLGMKTAVATANGTDSGLERAIFTEAKIVTKDNYRSPEIQKLWCKSC